MPYKKYPLIRKKGIRTTSIHDRKFQLGVSKFGRPVYPGTGISGFFTSLPQTGVVQELNTFAERVKKARKMDTQVILCLDESAALSGVNPIIVDLMERGWISALSVSWSFVVRDFEIALTGRTGHREWETDGFSVTEETGVLLASALKEGISLEVGGGEAVGLFMSQSQFPFSPFSLFYNAYKLNIPITIHPILAGDACQLHPHFDSGILGIMADRDFTLLSSILARIQDMGVWVHTGREDHLVKVLENALKFCSAKGISIPQLQYGVLADIPENQLEWFLYHAKKSEMNVACIPGEMELIFPLFSALLLCPSDDANSDTNRENGK